VFEKKTAPSSLSYSLTHTHRSIGYHRVRPGLVPPVPRPVPQSVSETLSAKINHHRITYHLIRSFKKKKTHPKTHPESLMIHLPPQDLFRRSSIRVLGSKKSSKSVTGSDCIFRNSLSETFLMMCRLFNSDNVYWIIFFSKNL
jgi:hypothetical protein